MKHTRIIVTEYYTKQERLAVLFPIVGTVREVEEVLSETKIKSRGALKVHMTKIRPFIDLKIRGEKIVRVS